MQDGFLHTVLSYHLCMKIRWASASFGAMLSLASTAHASATALSSPTAATSTGTLKLCAVENKTAVPAAYYAITGLTKPVEVKANTCRRLSPIAVGDVQIYQEPEAGQNPSSITVSPASRQDGPADLSNGTVTVDIARGARTTVTYTNQT